MTAVCFRFDRSTVCHTELDEDGTASISGLYLIMLIAAAERWGERPRSLAMALARTRSCVVVTGGTRSRQAGQPGEVARLNEDLEQGLTAHSTPVPLPAPRVRDGRFSAFSEAGSVTTYPVWPARDGPATPPCRPASRLAPARWRHAKTRAAIGS